MSDAKQDQKKLSERCDELELRCLDLEAKNADLLKRCADLKAYSEKVADNVAASYEQKLVDLKKALTEGRAVDPYFKVQAVTPRGEFWAIGRKFTREPQKILVKDLEPGEVVRLLGALPQHLSVTKVTHE